MNNTGRYPQASQPKTVGRNCKKKKGILTKKTSERIYWRCEEKTWRRTAITDKSTGTILKVREH
jgi:hypothetical protein